MPIHSCYRKHHESPRSYSRLDMKTIVNSVLLVLLALLAGIAIYLMYVNNILAFRYPNTIYTVLLVAVSLISLVLIIRKKGKIVVMVLLVIFPIVAATSLFAFKSLVDVANDMSKSVSYSEIEMNVVVPIDSSISDVTELSSVQAPTNADSSNIDISVS